MIKTKLGIETTVNGVKIIATMEKRSLSKSIKITQLLEKEEDSVLAFSMHLPTLDDVFIKLTGSSFRDETTSDNDSRGLAMAKGNRR